MTDLGTLDEDSSYAQSGAQGINNAGQVVGYSDTGAGGQRTFITDPNGAGMTALGTLGGTFSSASGINDAGQVAGTSETPSGTGQFSDSPGPHRPFITGPNGTGMTDLGTLGPVYGNSNASAINDAGQVVGDFYTVAGYRAFIIGPDGVGMTDLGTLGGSRTVARHINDAGQVVGYSETAADDYHAFIMGPNGAGMTDLNSLVSVQGLTLDDARAINNMGQVVVTGILVPEPETYVMLLAGLGLLGFIARRRKTV